MIVVGVWVKPTFHAAREKKTMQSNATVTTSILVILSLNPSFILAHLSLHFDSTGPVQV